MTSVSIGNELKDSFKETNNWTTNNLIFLNDIEQFYRQRAIIEREYSTKLQNLTNEYLKKKANKSTNISVGDEPKITPGSLESATLVTWNDILTQTESISKNHKNLSNEFNLKISDQINSLQIQSIQIQNKFENFYNNQLLKQKSEIFDNVLKFKKQYDDNCQSMESIRSKSEKSNSSSNSKIVKKLKEREIDMNISKNNYLLKINVANRIKDKFYYQDLPELLDLYQDLIEFKTKRLNSILILASNLEKNSNNKNSKNLENSLNTINSNESILDIQMFIKHNSYQWNEPQDFYYIPSSIWHDDDNLITSSNELNQLKQILLKSHSNDSKYSNSLEDLKESLNNLQIFKNQNKLIKDEDFELTKSLQILNNYLITLTKFIQDETIKVESQVEIETIENNSQGKDLSLDGLTITKRKTGFFNRLRGNHGHNQNIVISDDDSNNINDDNHSLISQQTSKSNKSTLTTGFKLGSLLRSKSIKSSSTTTAPSSKTTTTTKILQGTALYPYQSQGSDELSISSQEIFDIVEPDDGSGWTLINNKSGERGLVPTSYISVESIEKNIPPPVANSRKSGKKIVYANVLFEYIAEDEGELTIKPGEKVEIISNDEGDGWTLVKNIGNNEGLVPSSYVEIQS
ncbi:hypothetical protein WICMUC_001727 [Wickerhamomyces mucosus]|uniref:Protein BZZ1 n=1 Tax=Wickerhamomyces mucosus TaxID=1378264 RepID=A0A9P8PUQ1_9ASCO|nr:hypothetical protein WICMUC_001727 [Wickerhamomyces mucosus]